MTARETIAAAADDLIGLSHSIHELAELGFAEHRSVQEIVGVLAKHGHEADVGPYGLETALVCEAGTGAPRVAILAEYDALPDIGHGCGHNIICASAVGAFLGAAAETSRTGGSVVLIGTPAEENGGAKELLARAGAFEDVDAAIMLHPFTGGDSARYTSLGCRDLRVVYHGRPAHASASPEKGVNALDAVVAAYTGIGLLRQQLPHMSQVHMIITHGGSAVNVIPGETTAELLLRAPTAAALRSLSTRVAAVVRAAAAMTGCVVDEQWDGAPAYLPVRTNDPLARVYGRHLTDLGHDLDEAAGEQTGGSTDMGNVSVRVPAIHPKLGIRVPETVGMHTGEFAAAAVTTAADEAMLDGAVALASTAVDFLADAALREDVAQDFRRAGGAVDPEQLLQV